MGTLDAENRSSNSAPERASFGQDAREAIAAFAAKIGNELNNPIAAIQAAHEYIKRQSARDAKTEAMFAVIDGELANARRLVADLVDLSAARPLVRTSFALRDLVEGVARELKRPANVAFENAVPDDFGTISADRERLARALRRLAQNAAESVPGGRAGKVRVTAEREGEQLVISVTDDGEGIAPSISERIDEPLFSTKVKGTGLGLTIARALINEQGGSLSWVSGVDAGSTFKVFLPHA